MPSSPVNKSTGYLITFEGIDGCGKSTHALRALQMLRKQGFKATLLREAGSTPTAERIRVLLLDKRMSITAVTELLLYEASRAELTARQILPLLGQGQVVLCDRYYDSTTAYQGYGRSLPLDAVNAVNAFASGGTVPALTLFVDVGPEEIRRRKTKDGHTPDRMALSGDDFYAKVLLGYREIARSEPSRVVVVSGDGTIEETHAAIWAEIEPRLTPRDNQ